MANLYIDLTNGTDGGGGTLHDGLMEDNSGSNYAAIASTDNTHTYIAQGALDNDADDNYNGDYIYNVTRSLGALISDYDADDEGGNSVLTHAEIVGNVTTDEFYIIRAIKTIGYYTSTLARSAGDIAYVRANTTETVGAADIQFDEDGDIDNYIEIIGCDSVINDPWVDASDVKPILSFGDAAYQMRPNADDYWQLKRLVIKESADTNGNVQVTALGWRFIDCEFTDNTNSDGVLVSYSTSYTYFEGCVFKDNIQHGVRVSGGCALFKSCTFDGGGETTNYGARINGGRAEFVDCDFGQTTEHDNAEIYATDGAEVRLRNCKVGTVGFDVAGIHSVVFEEDTDGVKGSNKITDYVGTITKDTGVTRVGGADSSAKSEPNTNVCDFFPLTISGNSEMDFPFKIWTAAALTTITIYIRSLGTWGTYPTADELYIEASYLDEAATSASRAKVQSNDVLSHASDWKAFDVTFTPVQAGFVYLNVFLKLYEDAGDGCYVDIKPVVS